MTKQGKITWDDLKTAYDLRIAHLVPHSRRTAERAFLKLQERLKERFPEAFKDPSLLREMTEFKLRDKLDSGIHTVLYWAVERTLQAIKKIDESHSLTPDLNADLHIFTPNKILYCFQEWLIASGWKNITPIVNGAEPFGVTAQKDSMKLYARVAGSLWRDKYFISPDRASFKQRIGNALTRLMLEMHKEKNLLPCILFSDDATTRKAITPYLKPINQIGIKIFVVKSITEVHEIKK